MTHKNNQSKPRENTRVLQSMVTLSQNKAQTGAPRDEAKLSQKLHIDFAITLRKIQRSHRESRLN
jgi:hypothetical protein